MDEEFFDLFGDVQDVLKEKIAIPLQMMYSPNDFGIITLYENHRMEWHSFIQYENMSCKIFPPRLNEIK